MVQGVRIDMATARTIKPRYGVQTTKVESLRKKYSGLKNPKFAKGDEIRFNTYDSELKVYNGYLGVVQKIITDEKSVDIFDVGWMYKVRLMNGITVDAFEDELTRDRTYEYPRLKKRR